MVDVNTLLNFAEQLECWILYGAVVFACVSLAYYVYLKIIGKSSVKPVLASLLAIIFGFSGWVLITSITDPSKFLILDSNTFKVYMLLVGACFVSSIIYFASGKFEAGAKKLLSAFLVIFFLMLIPAIFNTLGINPTDVLINDITVHVRADPPQLPTQGYSNIIVDINDPGGSGWDYIIKVDGNVVDSGSTSSNHFERSIFFSGGNKTVAHGVTVVVWRSDNAFIRGVGGTSVVVGEVNMPMTNWLFIGASGLANWVMDYIGRGINTPLTWAYECPILGQNSVEMKVYGKVCGIALVAFVIYLAFNLVWKAFISEKIDEGIIESLKEALMVLMIIVFAPYLYNLVAGILNTISSNIATDLNMGLIISGVVSMVIISIVSGFLVPFIADVGAMVFMCFMAFIGIAYAKYLIIDSIITVSPILAVSYLHPALRNTVRHFLGLLASLMLAGPIIAIMLYLISHPWGAQGSLALVLQYFLAPFLVLLFPIGLTMGLTGNTMGGGTGLARIGSALTLGLTNRIAEKLGGNASGTVPKAPTTVFGGLGGGAGNITRIGGSTISSSVSSSAVESPKDSMKDVGIPVIEKADNSSVDFVGSYSAIKDEVSKLASNPGWGLRKLGKPLDGSKFLVPSSSFNKVVNKALQISGRVNEPEGNIKSEIYNLKKQYLKGTGGDVSLTADDILVARGLSRGVGIIKKDAPEYIQKIVNDYAKHGKLKYILAEADDGVVAHPTESTADEWVETLERDYREKLYRTLAEGDPNKVHKIRALVGDQRVDSLEGDIPHVKDFEVKSVDYTGSIDLRNVKSLDDTFKSKPKRVIERLSNTWVGRQVKKNAPLFVREFIDSLPYGYHSATGHIPPIIIRRRQ